MRQGEIWIANLEPVQGSEQGGRRPIVIISGSAMNESLSIVIAVPLTSKIKSLPASVYIAANRANALKSDAEALPFQVRTVTKARLEKRIGAIAIDELRDIIRGLFIVLTR